MKSLFQTLIGLFFFFSFSGEVFAKNDLSGEWKGQYLCGQGLTTFTLLLKPLGQSESVSEGTFYFYAHDSNPLVPSGKYTVKATKLDTQGRFEIIPIDWITQPKGYNFAQMYGSLIQDGAVMKGMVNLAGCKSFFAMNKNAESLDEVAGIPREVQAQILIDRVQYEHTKRIKGKNVRQKKNQQVISTDSKIPLMKTPTSSRTGFFKYEVESGINKICFYDTLGDLMALNVSGAEICPLSHAF